ncbi:hypothetical protein M8C21_027396, partial [Ambrosia artemisiifolia]
GTPKPIEAGDEMEYEKESCSAFEESLDKGDLLDSVYTEVELRRLSFLKQKLDHVARNASSAA